MNYYHPDNLINNAIHFGKQFSPDHWDKKITHIFTRFGLFPHIFRQEMSNKNKFINPPSVRRDTKQYHIEFMLDMTNF